MIRWLRARLTVRSRPLQDRLTIVVAAAVASAVALTGAAAYFITLLSVYTQLDNELVDVAAVTSTWLQQDLENMGGIDPNALRAANVTVELLRSDDHAITMPGNDGPRLMTGPSELRVAKLGFGSSSRSGVSNTGQAYRIIAVPLTQTQDAHYALVLGRPLAPTQAIMQSMLYALLTFGGLGICLAVLVGYHIARSSIQPVRALSEAVAHITATNKLTPIEVHGTDEVADLGRAFNRMLKALDSSRERQSRLIADAGHELRTPLTSMRTNTELLVADENSGMLPPGARGEILRDVAAQLGEFTTLVGDLVALSREDSVQAHPEPIDFREVVLSALSRVKRRGHGITWEVDVQPLYLVGEPDALERAVTNLLDNAVKFSPPNGTIWVELDGDRLRVADQGPGIAAEDLPHVFDRFYRSDQARTTPGSGLGLSIVAKTVQAHGGWVKAGRAPEGGAEFLMRLPGSTTPPEEWDDAPGVSPDDAPGVSPDEAP
ncbi:sensor histidine kinase [Nigerium massiliense]|uniref:sensor histidine kinase n=1 Tax=Nigerium massiliense TaxID=1522317 RepID=UPI000693F42B|nr:HAMP domain-containing sensor histidine kinase [Nigerium massiliense]